MIWIIAICLLLSVVLNLAQWFERQVLINTIARMNTNRNEKTSPIGFTHDDQ